MIAVAAKARTRTAAIIVAGTVLIGLWWLLVSLVIHSAVAAFLTAPGSAIAFAAIRCHRSAAYAQPSESVAYDRSSPGVLLLRHRTRPRARGRTP